MALYSLFKTLAFRFDPEKIHDSALNAFERTPAIARIFSCVPFNKKYQISSESLQWNFPIGLAAGLDKNARALPFFENLGFGSVEVGTVTLKPQIGNPKPRVFRLPEAQSLRNSMGFPSAGAEFVKKKLQAYQGKLCIGVNIGKNKETSVADTPQEYATLYELLAPHAHYMIINISSPNTPGLRDFQKIEMLESILSAVTKKQKSCPRPLFIKISPDINETDLDDILSLVQKYSLQGLVATNTTIRTDLGAGGISGQLLKDKAHTIHELILRKTKHLPHFTLIGVGGFSDWSDVVRFWKNGGKYIQIYSSFIYQGPTILKDIQENIEGNLKKYQLNSLEELLKRPEILKQL
ncbi:MAG: quinone-dependent dihydroorotate dehydrogenase [Bacteriovoracaceae bacterium]|nr:quinone-dependent dihydroorotate dehydrogenase [Bacteriovoracaceae bacterium]